MRVCASKCFFSLAVIDRDLITILLWWYHGQEAAETPQSQRTVECGSADIDVAWSLDVKATVRGKQVHHL
jgi:hypothetical protein